MSNSSFVNGVIVGAGAVMALMSVGFLFYVAPLENQQGITTTEIRVAIFLGGIVAAVALAYEFYSKNKEPTIDYDSHKTIQPEPKESEPIEKTDGSSKSETKDTKESQQ